MYRLLEGLRVMEGASFIAGPSCGLHLAQMGAEVIRFDMIGGGPDYNRWPLAPDSQSSLYWEGLNKGKKSIAIDISRPEGRGLAMALAAETGLFVTNYPVDGFLSYEKLKALREDVICVRVMGWADGTPAMDYTINAATGIPLMTGPAGDDQPVNHVLPAWDLIGGAYAAFATVSAELNRRATGKGAELRLPLSDIAAASLSHTGMVAEALLIGERERSGNDLYGAFGRDFVLADGHRIMVVAITPRQWKALVATLNLGETIAALESELQADFTRDECARYIHRARLFALFEAALATRSIADLAPALEAGGVTWGPYQTLREAVTSDNRLFTTNPIFETIQNPSGLAYPAAGAMASIADVDRDHVRPAPRLGEHTDEVLADILGLDSGAIGKLHDRGVVASC